MTSYLCGAWMESPQVQMQVAPDLWRPLTWLTSAWGQQSSAGIRINEDSALGHTALWHGLQLIGGDAGSLERQLRRRDGEGFVSVTDHPAYEIANVRANAWMCSNDFWEMIVPRAILHGNAVCEIRRRRNGRILPVGEGGGLIPLPPATTHPFMDDDDRLWIKTREYLPNGKLGPERMIDPDDTFHLRGLSTDGFWGRSLIDIARDRIANGIGMMQQSNRMMNNGMNPDWLFTFPMPIDPEDRIAYEEMLRQRNKGIGNTGNSLFLDNDAKAQQLGMSNESAQFADLVKLDIVMVASLLNIPANMLNAMVAMTFSNAEESERWYINRTLRRWLHKIHKELAAKLLTDRERENHDFQTNLDPLLMGRLAERYTAYSQAISAMWLRRNEVRQMEGLNPDPDMHEIVNPHTTSQTGQDNPDGNEDDVDVETVGIAAKLRAVIEREDREVAKACLSENHDVLQWLDDYYHGELLQKLLPIVPHAAEHYTRSRYNLWRKTIPHVRDRTALGQLVDAHKQTAPERISCILHGGNGYAAGHKV